MAPILDAFRNLTRIPLFRRDAVELTPWQVVLWWEARRLPFNLVVGVTGAVTCAVMLTIAVVCEKLIGIPIGMPDPPIVILLVIGAYAGAANLCYTGGWAAELFALEVWGGRARSFGEIAFGLGVLFAVMLTLLPAALTVVVATVQLALHLFGLSPGGAPGA